MYHGVYGTTYLINRTGRGRSPRPVRSLSTYGTGPLGKVPYLRLRLIYRLILINPAEQVPAQGEPAPSEAVAEGPFTGRQCCDALARATLRQ